MNSRLIKELPELVANNVISHDVAAKIEDYYSTKQTETPNRLFAIFGVLGSLLVGLGIILILAHNWDHFNRMTKTILAFIPLLIGQVIVGFSILKEKSQAWKEASGTFLFFAVGSSIALVSQIYNIPGNLSTYILTWIAICLPVMYLLKSNMLAILHLVFSTYYAFEVGYGHFSIDETPWLYLLLIALALPHYLELLKHKASHNITSIFNWLYPLSFTIVLGAFVNDLSELGFLMYLLLFSLFYNIGKLPYFDDQKLRRNGYLIFGSLGIIILMLIMSFDDFWFVEQLLFNAQESYVSFVLAIANVMLLIWSYNRQWIKSFNLFQYVFIVFLIMYLFQLNLPTIGTLIVNVLIFVLGLTTVKIGVDKFHFGILNYGLCIVTALVICRFFDTNISFVVRGLLFVGVGVGFFLTNYIMLQKQKRNKEQLK
ncbi:DUF2157 domain-containing protein [Psychroserpens sp. XS_ASV72]|uniref:DUF2157 domain-containing protein n=1 Tax=Psychroserpens sp. XS_ASV72 TaxID=3241293 RepID=UPI003517EFF9